MIKAANGFFKWKKSKRTRKKTNLICLKKESIKAIKRKKNIKRKNPNIGKKSRWFVKHIFKDWGC